MLLPASPWVPITCNAQRDVEDRGLILNGLLHLAGQMSAVVLDSLLP